MFDRFIIKWQKGWFKALGLHHASITVGAMIITWFIVGAYLAASVWGGWCIWFALKERRENGDKIEILDVLSPFALGGLTLWLLLLIK